MTRLYQYWPAGAVFILLCFFGPLAIDFGSGAPLTLQSFFLCLLLLLEPKRSWIFVLAYLLLGALGLPIFSKYEGGWEKLTGPTFGFFVGFLLASVMALLLKKWDSTCSWNAFYKSLIWHGVILFCGFSVLFKKGMPLEKLTILFFELAPGIILKSVVAAVIFILWTRYNFKRQNL
jgi:biotin transporter BioY